MSTTQPESVGTSRAYWTHRVDAFPSPVAQFRMAQLVDYDERLYENARIVYRFLVGWYHDQHGDALLSQRHVAKVMKQRAPEGAAVLSNRTVGRAIIALCETGWVARTFKGRGKGKGASRYVPVINVLELAAQGKFPQLGHSGVPVEPGHSSDPLVGQSNGPVGAELSHSIGPKTLPPDSATEPKTGMVDHDFALPVAGLSAAPGAKGGFDELFTTYGVRQDKADARRAYDNLAPSPELHARMVDAAKAWRDAAGGIERMRLRRWIEEERYDEEPKGKREPKPKEAPRAVNDNPPARPPRRALTIIEAKAMPDGVLKLYFDNETNHEITTEHRDPQKQGRGQRELSSLAEALGFAEIDDTKNLVGKSVSLASIGNGEVAFTPAAAAA